MTQQHSTTPPPELIEQWMQVHTTKYDLARQAAQWGADQELEACCEWVSKYLPYLGDFPMPEDKLRAARRPKPTSLKEQALKEMDKLDAMWDVTSIEDKSLDIIRRALEQLPDPS